MSIEKTTAFVLQSRKQGETSKILSLYTLDFGKFSAMVKGSRNIKSRHWGSLETLTQIKVIFYRNENRSLQYIKQADVSNAFPFIHSHLANFSLAMVPCEMILKGEENDHPNRDVFELLLRTLLMLESHEKGLRHIVRFFQWRYMELHGFKPAMEHCSICQSGEISDFCAFFPEAGEIRCPDCQPDVPAVLRISGRVLRYLRWLDRSDIRDVVKARIPASQGDEIDALLLLYMKTHMETLANLKTIDYLDKMITGLSPDS